LQSISIDQSSHWCTNKQQFYQEKPKKTQTISRYTHFFFVSLLNDVLHTFNHREVLQTQITITKKKKEMEDTFDNIRFPLLVVQLK
jgi:hypothetical protein